MNEFWFAILFFLPAGLANASPPIGNKIPYLNRFKTPMDFGKSWHDERIFGQNKSWRGLLFGTLVAAISGYFVGVFFGEEMIAFHPSITSNSWLESTSPELFFSSLGALLGFGALIGDAVESFFKRRSGVSPGESWFPFDQIDYIVGALIAITPIVILSWRQYLIILILWFALHMVFSYVGYLLKLKDKPI